MTTGRINQVTNVMTIDHTLHTRGWSARTTVQRRTARGCQGVAFRVKGLNTIGVVFSACSRVKPREAKANPVISSHVFSACHIHKAYSAAAIGERSGHGFAKTAPSKQVVIGCGSTRTRHEALQPTFLQMCDGRYVYASRRHIDLLQLLNPLRNERG